jgi:hypothetical protein
MMYWKIGRVILARQDAEGWGAKVNTVQLRLIKTASYGR